MNTHRTDARTAARSHAPARRPRGVTLVESTIVLAIVAVTIGAAAPSFQQARERRHLEGAAAQLETDLQLARAGAVARNAGLRVDFSSGADGHSCYVVHGGAAGDCSCAADGAAVCRSGDVEVLRSVRYGAELPVRLASNSRSIQFDPVKGTATPTATVRVTGRDGAEIRQIVNVMGRVRSCSPGGGVPGYPAC